MDKSTNNVLDKKAAVIGAAIKLVFDMAKI